MTQTRLSAAHSRSRRRPAHPDQLLRDGAGHCAAAHWNAALRMHGRVRAHQAELWSGHLPQRRSAAVGADLCWRCPGRARRGQAERGRSPGGRARCPGRPGSVAGRVGFGNACRCRVDALRHISGTGLLNSQSWIPATEAGAITFENLQKE